LGGTYEVRQHIGLGATSHVYRCRRLDDAREVAVKVLFADLAERQSARARFMREAWLARELQHGNLVGAHEVFDLPDLAAYVMDYVRGPNLRRWAKQRGGAIHNEELFTIFFDVLAGLEHVHALGVIHRDLKPANILVDTAGPRPVARLIDFGVARLVDERPDDEERSTIRGTPAYMSPDELRSVDEVCPASDLYSLGVILYELACGARPFHDKTGEALWSAHLYEEPILPSRHNPNLHPALEAVILKLLAKTPDARFGSVYGLRQALVAALDLSAELERVPALLPDADDEQARREWLALVQVLMTTLMAFLLNPGASGRADDPHYSNRAPDQLPLPV
jgi:serine/threonine-protein kinase